MNKAETNNNKSQFPSWLAISSMAAITAIAFWTGRKTQKQLVKLDKEAANSSHDGMVELPPKIV